MGNGPDIDRDEVVDPSRFEESAVVTLRTLAKDVGFVERRTGFVRASQVTSAT